MSRIRACILIALSVLIIFSSDSRSAENRKKEVDLVLVLAIDASVSVDQREWDLNKMGYAEALVHPEVIRAIQGGMIGAIAVTAVKWGHPDMQEIVLPWVVIHDMSSAEVASSILQRLPRSPLGNTSISGGITFSTALIESAPFEAARRVIDVSGDGFDNTSNRQIPNNSSFSSYRPPRSAINPANTALLHFARDAAMQKGITINGLPILTDMPWLDEYYRESVIGGPGAFVIAASDFESFAAAIRRKLVLEIAGRMPDDTRNRLALK